MILKEYSTYRKPKIYFDTSSKENLFIIEYSLRIFLGRRVYNVNINVHIPSTFPDKMPEFYIKKKPLVRISDLYLTEYI